MTRLPPDYDEDPGRWRAHDSAWLLAGDVHEPVARRICAEGLAPVLDVGGGTGALGHALPQGWPMLLVDSSPLQLAEPSAPKVLGDAVRLPVATASVGAVAMLWMLYHLEEPVAALVEAHRVLRPGGLVAACTASRHSDPELTDGYPASTFDAEEAKDIVGAVFDDIEVVSWDAPLTRLPDRETVVAYCRSHLLPPEAADRVEPPVILTKRGSLIYARR